jgi:hypothetical protein
MAADKQNLVLTVKDPTTAATLELPAPFPKQQLVIDSLADQILFGGTAGCAKSYTLLFLALAYHQRSIIFRTEYKQMRQMIDDSRELIGINGRLNEQLFVWRDLPGGRVLEFGAVKLPGDEKKFKGRAHDLKGFDELTEFLENHFRFLIGWNRTNIPGQRCRVVATTNPPIDDSGEWVIKYWAPWLDSQYERKAQSGELRYFITEDNKDIEVESAKKIKVKGREIYPHSRTFISATLKDNPVYLATGYDKVLSRLPEVLRRAYLDGDFDIPRVSGYRKVFRRDWIRASNARWKNKVAQGVTHVGVDVARGGLDKTVFAPLRGDSFGELLQYDAHETKDGQSVAQLALNKDFDEAEAFLVDVIGVGSSAFDFMKEVRPALGINFAEASTYTDRRTHKLKMINLRAEAHWRLMEDLEDNLVDLPPDQELENELCEIEWELTSRGVKIEDKDKIRARLGRSPNKADAVLLAWLGRSQGAAFSMGYTQPEKPREQFWPAKKSKVWGT